jgi:ParB-like chromosome segregation protein Spo0J
MGKKTRRPRVRQPGIHLVRRIEIWPIAKLKPYAKNSRTHSDAQVAELGDGFEEFGMNQPLTWHPKIGIVTGEGRYRAALKKGLTHLPVIRVDHLTTAQARAYLIADNKLADKAGWNKEILSDEMRELEKLGNVDLNLLGFSEYERSVLLPKGELKRETVDEPPKTRIARLKKTAKCPGCGLEFAT